MAGAEAAPAWCEAHAVGPEDLHRAAPKRFWLLHNALKLSAAATLPPDEHELADRFGHMELAANA